MNQRLLRGQRIRKAREFEILFEKGNFGRGKLVNLWAYRGPEILIESQRPRLGLIVSRKTSLRANQRNLWKRRIREIFRRLQPKIKANTAIMIQSKKTGQTPASAALESEIESLLKKTDSLK